MHGRWYHFYSVTQSLVDHVLPSSYMALSVYRNVFIFSPILCVAFLFRAFGLCNRADAFYYFYLFKNFFSYKISFCCVDMLFLLSKMYCFFSCSWYHPVSCMAWWEIDGNDVGSYLWFSTLNLDFGTPCDDLSFWIIERTETWLSVGSCAYGTQVTFFPH